MSSVSEPTLSTKYCSCRRGRRGAAGREGARQRSAIPLRRANRDGDGGVRRAGAAIRLLGAFGSDEHGRLIRNALKSCGVDVRESIDCDAPNRGAVILVDPQGNRTVLWHRSDRLKLPFEKLRPSALQARVVHVDDDDPEMALHAATSPALPAPVVTSDLEHVSDSVEQLIASVTFPIFEQNLPASITGEQRSRARAEKVEAPERRRAGDDAGRARARSRSTAMPFMLRLLSK